MLASCFSFLERCGFPLHFLGLSPLIVLGRRQPFRLFTSTLENLSLDHLLGNLPTLVSCGSYLESTNRLTAAVLSLTALSNSLHGKPKYKRMTWPVAMFSACTFDKFCLQLCRAGCKRHALGYSGLTMPAILLALQACVWHFRYATQHQHFATAVVACGDCKDFSAI